MKKAVSLFLALSVFVCMISSFNISACASDSDYWYRVLDDGTAEIWNYAGSDEDVIIPSVIDGYTVTSIGYPAFSSSETVKNILIPSTITSINKESFVNCMLLENIEVETGNLYYASQDGVLFNKDKTNLIQYPSGRYEVLYEIPDGITTISEYAFSYSTGLKAVKLSDSVQYINNSFNLCNGLERIDVSSGNRFFSSQGGVLFNKDQTQLFRYPIGNTAPSYNLPENVSYIGYRAFYNCESLQNITLPDSLTFISYEAFAFCSGLKSVTIPGSVSYIESRAFMSCTGLTSAVIKNGVKEIETGAFSNCVGLTSMVIPKSVYYISNLAFSNCTNLNSVAVLNPSCTFAVCKNAVPPNAVMYGYKNSTAQTYAQTYGRTFIAVDNYMVDALGGSIRITDAGLRFGFSFDKAQLNSTESIEEYGFVYSYTETEDLYLFSADVKKAVANHYIDHGDTVTFNLVFTDVPKSAFDQVISARAYVKIDGVYCYSDILQRSFRGVANSVLEDDQIEQSVKDKINIILK